jgi:hypothetical protein
MQLLITIDKTFVTSHLTTYVIRYMKLVDEIQVEEHSNGCTQCAVIVQREITERVTGQSEVL